MQSIIILVLRYQNITAFGFQPFKDETYNALFKDPVRTAL